MISIMDIFPSFSLKAPRIAVLSALAFMTVIGLSPEVSRAYKLKLKTTLSRTAENHGHGLYSLVQDVIFLHTDPPSVIRETWIIKNGESMKLEAHGKGNLKNQLALSIVYTGNIKNYLMPNGKASSTNISNSWFEPYFFFRFKKNILPRMLQHQMIPETALFLPPIPKKMDQLTRRPQLYVRLARANGFISYGIGWPTPVNQPTKNSGLWIGQDSFVVHKLRLPSQVEVKASKYQKFKSGFWFARERDVSWDGNKVTLKVLKISKLSAKFKKQLVPGQLNSKQDHLTALPEDSVIKDFYLKFR